MEDPTLNLKVPSTKVLLVIPCRGREELTKEVEAWLTSDDQPFDWCVAPEKGYGFAIRKAMMERPGYDVYVTLDNDLAMNPSQIWDLIHYVTVKGYDVVVGSRHHEHSVVRRTWLRGKISGFYNRWCERLFHCDMTEYLCGFRAFSKNVVEGIVPITQEFHWMWQVEMIVLSEMFGYAVKDIPIEWTEYRYKRTPLKRLFKDMKELGWGTLKLWWDVRKHRLTDREYGELFERGLWE